MLRNVTLKIRDYYRLIVSDKTSFIRNYRKFITYHDLVNEPFTLPSCMTHYLDTGNVRKKRV